MLNVFAKLKVDGARKLILPVLDTPDKEMVYKNTRSLKTSSNKAKRRRGQDMPECIREEGQQYMELTRMDGSTKLSDDLYAYFLLDRCAAEE